MKTKTVVMLALALAAGTLLFAQRESRSSEAEGSGREPESGVPVLVLEGLDPISLAGGKKEEGKGVFDAVHEGYRYYFASQEHRNRFQSNPSEYAVRDQDPVARVRLGQQVRGKPDIFAVHDGHIFLFAGRESRQIFLDNPREFLGSHEAGSAGSPEGSGSRQF